MTRYIADVEKDVSMKELSLKEALKILEDMKVDIPVPKAAVTQHKRNCALDMAIEALKCSETPNSSKVEWIPRKVRKPEDGQLILVAFSELESGCSVQRYSETANMSFKAWMPLPNPYQPKEELRNDD